MDGDGSLIRSWKMPETDGDLWELLSDEDLGGDCTDFLRITIEKVGAMPGQGVASTFKFGVSYGTLRGMATALQVPVTYVAPGVWQRKLGCLTKGDKNISKRAAQERWPEQRWTHATADAALIAEYGRLKAVEEGRVGT